MVRVASFLFVMSHAVIYAQQKPLPTAITPTAAVHAVGGHIIGDSKDAKHFQTYGYGQSIILDAMMLAAEKVDGMQNVMPRWVNPVLDHYLNTANEPAYNLTHGLRISSHFIGNAVGDKVGLFPHAYLHRYSYYTAKGAPPPPDGYDSAKDLEVARNTVDEYILRWNIRWTDGTVTRDYPGHGGWANETGDHQFVWSDDAYMGLTLPSRMVVAGLDTAKGDYARFVSTQNALFYRHLVDNSTGVFWHGRDAKTGRPTCCKWGRANGWAMMSHVETLAALSASHAPFAKQALQEAQKLFLDHATALAALQNKTDGRWHQLLDDDTMFLETSVTAMTTVALVRGVRAGWLDKSVFQPVIDLAWRGLQKVIHSDGFVSGICDGFGIHSHPSDYRACPTLYGKSTPGLGSVLKAVVLLSENEGGDYE